MNVETRAIHFEFNERSKAYLDSKLERLHYVKDMIVDLIFVISKEKDYKLECTANFRWGTQAHIEEREFDLDAGIDKLIDRLETKVSKEKEKIQEKTSRGHGQQQTG